MKEGGRKSERERGEREREIRERRHGGHDGDGEV